MTWISSLVYNRILGLNAAKAMLYNVTVRDFYGEILEVYKIFFKETGEANRNFAVEIFKTKPDNQYQVINDRCMIVF